MAGVVGLVTAISNNVVAALAVAGYPALVEGKILLGRQHQAEATAPPRIMFIPMGSTFGAKDLYNVSNVANAQGNLSQLQQRSIQTEYVTFEVRCWAVYPGGASPDLDFDYTQTLYQQVIASAWLVCGPFTKGGISAESGKWVDAEYGSSQFVTDGREFVFGLTLPTPVPDVQAPLPLAPSTTRTVPGINMTIGGQTPENA